MLGEKEEEEEEEEGGKDGEKGRCRINNYIASPMGYGCNYVAIVLPVYSISTSSITTSSRELMMVTTRGMTPETPTNPYNMPRVQHNNERERNYGS